MFLSFNIILAHLNLFIGGNGGFATWSWFCLAKVYRNRYFGKAMRNFIYFEMSKV